MTKCASARGELAKDAKDAGAISRRACAEDAQMRSVGARKRNADIINPGR
jgi:hypothetical protein